MKATDYEKLVRQAEYREYLQTEHWQEMRRLVAARSGGRCETPGCDQPAREVHHVRYANRYAEALTDLLHLCSACHIGKHPKDEPSKPVPQTCRKCGKELPKRKNKNRHKQRCQHCGRRARPLRFQCQICQAKWKTNKALTEHLFKKHRVEKGYEDLGHDMKAERKRIAIEWDRRTFATVVKDTRKAVAEAEAKRAARKALLDRGPKKKFVYQPRASVPTQPGAM